MSIKLPDIVQKARVDLTDYRKAVAEATRLGKSLSKSLDDADKSTQRLDRSSKALATDLNKVDVAQRRVTKSSNETRKATTAGSGAFDRYRTSVRGAKSDLGNLDSSLTRLRASIAKTSSDLRKGLQLPDVVQRARVETTGGDTAGIKRLPDLVQRIRVDTKGYRASIAEVRKLNAQLNADINRTMLHAAQSAESLVKATDEIGDATKRVTRDTHEAERGIGRFHAVISSFNNDRKAGMKDLSGFFSNLVNQLKVPAIAGGVQLLTASLSSLTAGAIALGGALAPAIGLLGAAPGALLALQGGILLTTQMMAPLNKAADAVAKYGANSTQAAAAMKGMSKEQKGLVKELGGVKSAWQDTIKAVTAGAAPGLTTAFSGIKKLLPQLKPEFKAFGAQIGDIGKRFSGLFTSKEGTSQVKGILASTVQVFGSLGRGAVNFGKVLMNVMTAARPLTERLGKDFEKFSAYLRGASGDTGRLTRFFDLAYDVGKNVGTAFLNVGKAIYNIGRIGTAVFGGARGITGGIADATAKLTAWTKSGPGVASITKFFQDAKPVLKEVGLLVKDLVKGLLSMSSNSDLAPLISQIRTQLLPAVLDLVKGVGSQLGPALVNLATAAVKFVNVLSFSPLLTMVGTFAKFAIVVADVAGKIPILTYGLSTLLSLMLAFKGVKMLSEFAMLPQIIGSFKAAQGGIAGVGVAAAAAGKPVGLLTQFFQGWRTPAMGATEKAFRNAGLAVGDFRGAVAGASGASLTFAQRLGSGSKGALTGNLAQVRGAFRLTGAEVDKFKGKLKSVGKIGLAVGIAAALSSIGNDVTKTTLNAGKGLNELEDAFIKFGRGSSSALDILGTTVKTGLGKGPLALLFGPQAEVKTGFADTIKNALDPGILENTIDKFSSGLKAITLGVADFGSPVQSATAALESWNTALVNMVNDGHGAEAAKTVADLRAQWIAMGKDPAQFDAAFAGYRDAVIGVGNAADTTTGQLKTLDEVLNGLKGTTASADEATANMYASIREAKANMQDYAGAVNKAHTALNLTSEGGQNAQRALMDIRNAALDSVPAWEAAGEGPKQIAGKIQTARDEFIKLAGPNGMGLTIGAAKALADTYGLIPGKVETKITADASQAKAEVAAAQAKINELKRNPPFVVEGHVNIDGTITTRLVPNTNPFHTTKPIITPNKPKAVTTGVKYPLNPVTGHAIAEGGPVTGAATATGKTRVWVSNGEFEIPAAIAKRNRALLDRINNQRLADGGLIKGPGTGTSDSIPRMMHIGDYVVNAKATKKYRSVLEDLLAHGKPTKAVKFATGGSVAPVSQGEEMMRRLRAASRAASTPGPMLPPGVRGGGSVVTNIDNSRKYDVVINETRGPSTEDSISARLRRLETSSV